MATEDVTGSDSEPTNQQIMETVRGLQSRVQKLEDENADLRNENQQLKEQLSEVDAHSVNCQQLNILLQSLTGADLDDVTADPVRHNDVVTDFNSRVTEIESTVTAHEDKISNIGQGKSSGPEEAWHNIVQAANRLAGSRENGLPDNRVCLYIDNIAQATGRSERMASNYIDRFGGDKDAKRGVTKRDYEPAASGNGNEARRKSLVIDLDVWGEDDE